MILEFFVTDKLVIVTVFPVLIVSVPPSIVRLVIVTFASAVNVPLTLSVPVIVTFDNVLPFVCWYNTFPPSITIGFEILAIPSPVSFVNMTFATDVVNFPVSAKFVLSFNVPAPLTEKSAFAFSVFCMCNSASLEMVILPPLLTKHSPMPPEPVTAKFLFTYKLTPDFKVICLTFKFTPS
ncbi:MAG: hypothetical protein IKP62_00475 [Salinivirgaceae bacterium]|nr:hypothetical protein [Salinivirgaceae bacterium]